MSISKHYKNKKVLITGHTGFKGAWLTAWLKMMGAEICGISLDPLTSRNHFEATNLQKRMVS